MTTLVPPASALVIICKDMYVPNKFELGGLVLVGLLFRKVYSLFIETVLGPDGRSLNRPNRSK